jgi:F0F1-type ATP synthase delta subunit
MYIKDYVEATYETLQNSTDTFAVLESLRQYLSRRGLGKLYPAVLRGVVEKFRRKEKSGALTVVVAREADIKRHEEEIARALQVLGETSGHAVKVDETMIGGYIVKNQDRRIDQSYKNRLLHAYHRLID